LPAETLALAAIIVAGGYLVFGLTGFGSTVLALPLLAHLFPLKFAVPLLLLLDAVATLVLGTRARKGIRFDELGRLVPFMLVGIGLGLTLLIQLPEPPLIAGLGVFLLAYAGWGLWQRGTRLRLSPLWSAPIGLAGGALSALFGTGGVLFAMYAAGRLEEKSELRATTAAAIMVTAFVRVVLFAATGLLTQEGLLPGAALLLPAMLLGFTLGSRMHAGASVRAVVRGVYAVLIVAGISLLARALAA
jgi:uncharacterized protein